VAGAALIGAGVSALRPDENGLCYHSRIENCRLKLPLRIPFCDLGT